MDCYNKVTEASGVPLPAPDRLFGVFPVEVNRSIVL
jgi:hypothetical protein